MSVSKEQRRAQYGPGRAISRELRECDIFSLAFGPGINSALFPFRLQRTIFTQDCPVFHMIIIVDTEGTDIYDPLYLVYSGGSRDIFCALYTAIRHKR